MLCDAPGSDTIWRTTQYCPLWKYKGSGPNPPPLTSLKDLSLWACSFLGFSSLNGFSHKTRPPCVEPMTLKSFEFHTWVPLGNTSYIDNLFFYLIKKSWLLCYLWWWLSSKKLSPTTELAGLGYKVQLMERPIPCFSSWFKWTGLWHHFQVLFFRFIQTKKYKEDFF